MEKNRYISQTEKMDSNEEPVSRVEKTSSEKVQRNFHQKVDLMEYLSSIYLLINKQIVGLCVQKITEIKEHNRNSSRFC